MSGKAGVLISFYPAVLKRGVKAGSRMAGRYRGIPVFWSVGDNQASFFGAAGRSEDAVCVNVGTGIAGIPVRSQETSLQVGRGSALSGRGISVCAGFPERGKGV